MSPHVCTKINKKHVLFWIAAMLIVAFGLPNTSRSGEPNWPETLTIGTASPGGTYYRYGEGLARLLTRKLGLPVIARPTEGAAENIKLLESGEIQLAFVTLGIAQQGWSGTADWTGGRQFRTARALFPMYDTPFQFIVTSDSPLHSITDLSGKQVGVGPEGGTGGVYTQDRLAVFQTLPLALLFGESRPGDLGVRVSDRRNLAGKEYTVLASRRFGGHVGLMNSLMRKHRLANDIADREDMRHVSAHLLIDRNEPAVTDRDTRFFGLDCLSVRASPNRDQNHVIHLYLARQVLPFKTDANAVRRCFRRYGSCPQHNLAETIGIFFLPDLD